MHIISERIENSDNTIQSGNMLIESTSTLFIFAQIKCSEIISWGILNELLNLKQWLVMLPLIRNMVYLFRIKH